MFNFKNLVNVFNNNDNKNKKIKDVSLDEIANLLHLNRKALDDFETAYQKQKIKEGVSDNLFNVSAEEAKNIRNNNNNDVVDDNNKDNILLNKTINQIVEELLMQTETMVFDGKNIKINKFKNQDTIENVPSITNDVLSELPVNIRPQLTGNLMSIDISETPSIAILNFYSKYINETSDMKKKKQYYGMFRRGLDMLDLDKITYEIIGTNKNSIGFWFPKIVDSFIDEGFFKIPKTSIIKVPLTLLQLTRKDYMNLTPTTIKIVDKYCQKAFSLNIDNDYFIKTGTYSSKFDFRNAHVSKGKEVLELGEYLLYIHYQALCMSHYDLSGKNQPSIYGVSTTNEWCVREYIEDKDDRPTIYNGLPLHTEYRAFVDFDTKEILGIHNYWDSKVMKHRFSKCSDSDTTQMKHDYITFSSCEDDINRQYNENKDLIVSHLQSAIKDINMTGQWSIDIMQNGNDFYIIDMALAENSAYYNECVPIEKRKPQIENWIPKLN